jgi:hypothetical protein
MANSRRAYQFCGVTIASDRALPALRRGVLVDAQCAITSRPPPLPREPAAWFHEWRLPGGRRWLSIGRVPSGYLLRFPGQADFVVSADGDQIAVYACAGLAEETLHHLLIDQVLPLALSRRGRLALHASAVHLPGLGTVGFVGATGRGKSTLAAALAARGGRIITDDCLAIDVVDDVARATPGYPGLRLWPGRAANPLLRAAASSRVAHYSAKRRLHRRALPFHGRPSPLRLLFMLLPRAEAGPLVSIRRCRAPARLIGLLRCAYVLDVEDRDGLIGLFTALADVVTTVPVVRLRLRAGHARLPAAAEMIGAYAASLARQGCASRATLSA